MHSFHGKTVNIHHNGDYSGNAIIMKDGVSVEVDMEDLVNFVAGYVRNEKISSAESVDNRELLGLPMKKANKRNLCIQELEEYTEPTFGHIDACVYLIRSELVEKINEIIRVVNDTN